MGSAHSEVQAFKTASHQDLSDSDIGLDELDAALYREQNELYSGPGAFTFHDIMARYNVSDNTARRWARRAVKRGDMVEVTVQRVTDIPGAQLTIQAWVPVRIYEEWRGQKEDNDAGSN